MTMPKETLKKILNIFTSISHFLIELKAIRPQRTLTMNGSKG